MRKVINVFLGLIIFVTLIVFSVLLVGRRFLSPSNMTTLMNIVAKDEGGYDKFIDIVHDTSEGSYEKYIDDKKFEKALSVYLSSYFKVQAGVLDKMDSEELEEVLGEAVDKYNKNADEKIARSEVKKAINELDKELKSEKLDKDVKKIFEVIYSKTIFICAGVIIVCLLLIYVTYKRLDKVLFHLGLTSLFNGLLVKLGATLFSKYIADDLPDEAGKLFSDNFAKNISTIGIVSIVIGVVLLVASFILKKALDEKRVAKPEQVAEPVKEIEREIPVAEEVKEEPTSEDNNL